LLVKHDAAIFLRLMLSHAGSLRSLLPHVSYRLQQGVSEAVMLTAVGVEGQVGALDEG
jgi:hypothetical protein